MSLTDRDIKRYEAERAHLTLSAHGFACDCGEPGHVYLIAVGDRIKIGYSADWARRWFEVNAQHPETTARVVALAPGCQKLERQVHNRFSEHRIEGEWFRIGGPLEAIVAAGLMFNDERTADFQRQVRSTP